MSRKGILLAGGAGTRLNPATAVVSKQLLPVYDKPMIYYPLSLLMHADIQDILVITTKESLQAFKGLLGTGSQWGLRLEYEIQPRANGIAEALTIGKRFLAGESVCLVLGDNILHGPDIPQLMKTISSYGNATVFAVEVNDAWRYGVVEFDKFQRAVCVIEKPAAPPSPWAVPGVYFLPHDAPECAAEQRPSQRGELEITDVINAYMGAAMGASMYVHCLERGTAWLDAGTPEALLAASQYVHTIQERQGVQIACLEEIAYRKDWITVDQLRLAIGGLANNSYHNYINRIIDEYLKTERKSGQTRFDQEADPPIGTSQGPPASRLQGEGSRDVFET